jgi:hypothetical protein
MAETIISPGVFTRENDISFIQPAPVTAGAAIIGPAVKGPVEIPTLVTSYGDYVRKFGTTFTSGSNSYEFLTSIAVKNYFQQGGNSVLVSRAVTGSFSSATSTKITNNTVYTPGLTASGTASTFGHAVDGQQYIVEAPNGTEYKFTAIDGELPADIPAANQWYFAIGADADGTVDNLETEITNAGIAVIGGANATGDTLQLDGRVPGTAANGYFLRVGVGTAVPTDTPVLTVLGGTQTPTVTSDSFILATIGSGTVYNNATDTDNIPENSDNSLVSGTSDNIRWEISNVNAEQGTFKVSIRQGDDSLKNKVVLETFNNVSLDPKSANYIESLIGNQYQALSTDGDGSKYINTVGEYVNKSN